MYYLEILQQLRQGIPDCFIDISGTETSADDHDHRLIRSKSAHVKSRKLTALGQFRTDGRTGEDGFVCRNVFHGLREIAAYLFRNRNTQLIGQTRCHVGFMNNTGNMQGSCGADHGNAYEAALGKYYIRLIIFQIIACLHESLHDTEGIREVLRI